MDSVLLFSLTNDTIKVTVEAYFNVTGSLVIDGYDIGKKVEEYWGDSDYEYSSTVAPDEVKKLYALFQLKDGEQQELLLAIQARFNTNTCYSELQNFLDVNKIKYEGFSWT
jgi:hypothetical protein